MVLRNVVRLIVVGMSLAVSLIVVNSVSGSLTKKIGSNQCRQVAVQLDTRETTQEQIAVILREQLNVCGNSATDDEIQTAARSSLNLIGKAKDPEKGVIYVNTKKFTICVSWGSDKAFCKSH